MKNQTTYTIQFFYGLKGVWRPTGLRAFTDLDKAREALKDQAEMCDYTVDLRIVETFAV